MRNIQQNNERGSEGLGKFCFDYATNINMSADQVKDLDLHGTRMVIAPADSRKGAAQYLEAEEEERNLLLHSAGDGVGLVVDEGGRQGHQDVQHAPHWPKYVCWQSPADHKTRMVMMIMLFVMMM